MQCLLFLLNAECLAQEQNIPILYFLVYPTELESTIYHTCGEHANHYNMMRLWYRNYAMDNQPIWIKRINYLKQKYQQQKNTARH